MLSLRGDREGGEADIELRAKGGDNRGEFGVMRAALLEAHHLGQCLVDVDVVADGGLSVGGHVLGRSVTRRSAVAQCSPFLDILRNQRGDVGVGGDLGDIVGRGVR